MVERLGVLGGTFDPVHVGHLVAAAAARHHLELTRVLLVVAGDPWQKQGEVVAPAEARYEMVAAAIDGAEGLEASRLEIDRPGLTYTIDTVEALQSPDRELFLIVGADVAARIDTWDRVEDLRDAVTLAIVGREDVPAATPPDGWHGVPVPMPRIDVSSTSLRRRIAEGAPVEFLIPLPAVRVLRAHDLYTARR
jgi:nicotinate-nucleotide adenylyltransferase